LRPVVQFWVPNEEKLHKTGGKQEQRARKKRQEKEDDGQKCLFRGGNAETEPKNMRNRQGGTKNGVREMGILSPAG